MLWRWLAWLEPMELLWAGSEARAQHLLSCCHSLAGLPGAQCPPAQLPFCDTARTDRIPLCDTVVTLLLLPGLMPGLGSLGLEWIWTQAVFQAWVSGLCYAFRQLALSIVLDWQKVEMIVSVDRELGTMWVYKQKQTVALEIKMFLLLACIQ